MIRDQVKYDDGLMTVLLARYKNQRLPTAQALMKKVNDGLTLNDTDLSFLKEVSKNIVDIMPLLNRHPECNVIATQMMNLCSQIATKGLSNEKA